MILRTLFRSELRDSRHLPHLPLRCAAGVLSLAILALFGVMVFHIRQFQFNDFTNFIQIGIARLKTPAALASAVCGRCLESRNSCTVWSNGFSHSPISVQ